MVITAHGKKDPLFKGVISHNSRTLTFFGWSSEHVKRKAAEWFLENAPVTKRTA